MIPWRAPLVAGLELTLRCPCRCLTCGSHAGEPRRAELGHDEWLSVIASLAALGCRTLSLLGGEPLLYPRWPELVQAARAHGVLVEMVSSGHGIDEEVAKEMYDAGLGSVTISVDGLLQTHDTQRGTPGSFARAMRAIRAADAAGLKVGVTTQANPRTLPELEAMAPVLEEAGVLGWQLQMTLPLGRAEAQPDLVLSPAKIPELLATLRRMQQRPGLRPHLTDNLGYCTSDDLALRTIQGGFPRPWLGCQAGIDVLGITSDGRVKGCLALPDAFSEGNVRKRPLAEIWHDPRAFAYNRGYTPESLSGACRTCDEAARCRGGCTAAAYALRGRPGTSLHCFRVCS